jgi:hypothetical protein
MSRSSQTSLQIRLDLEEEEGHLDRRLFKRGDGSSRILPRGGEGAEDEGGQGCRSEVAHLPSSRTLISLHKASLRHSEGRSSLHFYFN